MLLRPPIRPLLVLLLALLAGLPAAAESSADARRWLDKVARIYDDGSFTVDYTATIDLGQVGQAIRGILGGKMTYGDRSHRRLEMAVTLSGLPGAAGEEQAPMEIEMLSVSDGKVIWTELDLKELGGRQVMKIAQADVDKLPADQGVGGFAANPGGMDPVAQLELITRKLDFEVLSVTDGKVTLRGTLAAGERDSLGQLGALGADSFLLVLAESNGYPIEMSATAGPRQAGESDAAAGEPVVRMRFENLRQVERADLPAGIFEYQPPDGVPVTDLATMLGAAN